MLSEQESLSTSYLFGANAPYIEELYEVYLNNPASIPENWRTYFDQLQHNVATDGQETTRDQAHAPIVDSFVQRARANGFANSHSAGSDMDLARRQVSVQQLIGAYRSMGSNHANLDPLKRQERPVIQELDPAFYGLTEADLDQIYSAPNTYFTTDSTMTLRDMLKALRDTYCQSIGTEFAHMSDPVAKRWIAERLEGVRGSPQYSHEQKCHILQQLTDAEGFERFLHTKYVGQKRFSLEGGESFIVCMDEIVNRAAEVGVQEVIVGMAHRGRLNMLVNIMGKMPADLFAEFEGKHVEHLTDGDVKYHNGFSSDISTRGGPIHLSLAFNPSHLEIVNPVVEGSVRARQERRNDAAGLHVLPVLVHGDAAFAGQGVVMETLNLAQTRGYGTGGTLHVVINNQIGFTTSDPRDSRSTLYCTDVVKMIEAPVFHVNGDEPEAVVFVTKLALDYRQEFHHDVVIDIVCFRKLGHNEQDTPSLTQPLMYKSIGHHPGTRKAYGDKLVTQGVFSKSEPDKRVKAYRELMQDDKATVEPVLTNYKSKYAIDWSPYLKAKWTDLADTRVPLTDLQRLGDCITTVPKDFTVHPLVSKLLKDRCAMMGEGGMLLDWGMGEHLALASLVNVGHAVRITGQDSGRGTFSHRHAVWHDQNRERWDGGTYIPLQHISDNQAPFTVIDSVLSEEAVLAFEYGYSSAEPNTLTIFEAQFGDFINGAQVVIDQFISAGEAKWGRQSGLTLMLPHGYEGQGPEHSSARIERFLQLCADNNIQVVQPTNGAQVFHLLRRQMLRPFRKPLVILTPKSLLRNKAAGSKLSDLTEGTFLTIIGETNQTIDAQLVERVLVCSGKIYYDLIAYRTEHHINHVAVLRVEQLYPFAHKSLETELTKYPNSAEIIWVQDEPKNQGPWFYVQHHLYKHMRRGQKLGYAGRAASASPAVGYMAKHLEQQKDLLGQAYAPKFEGFMLTKSETGSDPAS